MSNKAYVLNYSNEVVTFPEYQIIDGNVSIQTNKLNLSVTGNARRLASIVSGDYLLCDTGDETSELRLITGINRENRKIIIAEPFTVEPLDTVIKVVKVQTVDTICVYNNGSADVYVDGQSIVSNDKVLWNNMVGQPPIVVYSTSDFQVSNGDVVTPEVLEPVGQALTGVNDTNVTLTLGGTPTEALLRATSLTLGWTGTLADARIASAATWNAKQNAITTGTSAQYIRGDLSLGTSPTALSQFTNDVGYVAYVGTPVNLTARSAAIAATTCYTLPAQDGFYRVSMSLCITQAATSSLTIGFQLRHTNAADNVVKTSPNVNDVTRTATNSTASVVSYTFVVYAKASSNIQYIVNYATSGATSAQFSFDLICEKIK